MAGQPEPRPALSVGKITLPAAMTSTAWARAVPCMMRVTRVPCVVQPLRQPALLPRTMVKNRNRIVQTWLPNTFELIGLGPKARSLQLRTSSGLHS